MARGRYYTDKSGSAQMLAAGRSHPDPAWAAEGGNGGKHIAHLLVHDEELVVDVQLNGDGGPLVLERWCGSSSTRRRW